MNNMMDKLMNNMAASNTNDRGVLLKLNNDMRACDRLYLENILKRQYYVLRDLYKLHDIHPDLIDVDLIGGIDGIFRALHDMAESIKFSSRY